MSWRLQFSVTRSPQQVCNGTCPCMMHFGLLLTADPCWSMPFDSTSRRVDGKLPVHSQQNAFGAEVLCWHAKSQSCVSLCFCCRCHSPSPWGWHTVQARRICDPSADTKNSKCGQQLAKFKDTEPWPVMCVLLACHAAANCL